MLKRILLSSVFPLAIAGCAAPPLNPAISTDHPANPNAPEAPIPPPSQTLAGTSSAEHVSSTSEPMQPETGMQRMGHDMGGMKHDMKGMDGMQHGDGGMQDMDHDMPGMQHKAPSTQPATEHGRHE
jgi:hypothetical protein